MSRLEPLQLLVGGVEDAADFRMETDAGGADRAGERMPEIARAAEVPIIAAMSGSDFVGGNDGRRPALHS